MQNRTDQPRGHLLAGACLVLVATAVLYRAPLFSGAEFESWDQARVYVPVQVANARQRSDGEIPLWFRHGFLGYPLQGETECSGVYPPALVFHLTDDPGTAWSLFLLFHQLVAIGGMLALLRMLGAGAGGATLAALVFVLGGTVVGEIPHATLITTLAWTPLVTALLLGAFRRRRLRGAVLAGLALAVQVSGGHPQVVFYTMLLLGLAVLCEARGEDRWRRFGFAITACLVTTVVGLGLAAPQVLYCFETMQLTDRWPGLDYDRQMNGSLPPHFLLQLILPGATGSDHRLQVLFVDLRIYAGLLTLPLAVVGWRRGPGTAGVFRWALALGLLLALGRYSGVFLAVGNLPGFSSIHVPARFLMIASLAIAGLAGLGLDHPLRQTATADRSGKRSGIALGILGVLLLVAGGIAHAAPETLSLDSVFGWGNSDAVYQREWIQVATAARTSALVGAGFLGGALALVAAAFCLVARRARPRLVTVGCLVLVSVDLVLAADRLNHYAPDGFYATPPPTVEHLRANDGPWRIASSVYEYDYDAAHRSLALLPDNTAGLYGIDSLAINPGARSDWLRRTSDAGSPKLHALLNVRFLVTGHELPALVDRQRARVSDPRGNYWIYEVPDHLPRVTVCRDTLVITDPDAVLATIRSPRFVLGETVILDRMPDWGKQAADQGPGPETVRLVQYRGQQVHVDATLARNGIVVLADLYHEGWQATDNGRPVPILRANGICRGVALGPGHHDLRFVYRPAGFYGGLWISGAVLLLLVLATAGVGLLRSSSP